MLFILLRIKNLAPLMEPYPPIRKVTNPKVINQRPKRAEEKASSSQEFQRTSNLVGVISIPIALRFLNKTDNCTFNQELALLTMTK